MQNRAVLKMVLLTAACAAAGAAIAMPFGKHRPANPTNPDNFVPQGRPVPDRDAQQTSSGGMSAKDAARQAQSLNGGGRVLSVEEAGGGYRVKLLKDGNVRFVFVPQ